MKSHTQHIKENVYQEENIHEHIIQHQYTENKHKAMNLNQPLSINPNISTWVFLTQLSASLLCSNASNYVTTHNEGVYIRFPSTPSKTV
jgi:hypothetical protein